MKKKTLLLLLAVSMFVLSACGSKAPTIVPTNDSGKAVQSMTPATNKEGAQSTNKDNSHVHSFGEWVVIEEASCTKPGHAERSCACGEKETKEISPQGHDYGEWIVEKNASCTENGSEKRTCARCGKEETRKITKTGHSFSAYTVEKEPTCDTNGSEFRTCSNCGKKETKTLAKLGHDYAEWTQLKKATCTESGKEKSKCLRCGETQERTISALGHDWKKADCTTPKTCKRCGITEGESLGHQIEDGVCKRCGEKFQVTLYEDDKIKITFKNAAPSLYYDDRFELYYYLENKTNKTLLVQADVVSLNGYCYNNVIISDYVTAKTTGIINVTVNNQGFVLTDIDDIRYLGGQFRIIDEEQNERYKAVFSNVKLDGTGRAGTPDDFSGKNLVYDDEKCAFYYLECRKNEYYDARADLYLFIHNKTQSTLLFQADSIAINGYSFSSLIMSDEVLPESIGIVEVSIRDFNFGMIDIDHITSIGGQLRVIDDATFHRLYKATFTNVTLTHE